MLGVLLLAGAGSAGGWRVPLLLLVGFTGMFLGDILWSLAKMRGYYLPGQLQDVVYLCCYVPLALAGREQLRNSAARRPRAVGHLGRCWRAHCPTPPCSQRSW